jgi:hypothetical protein
MDQCASHTLTSPIPHPFPWNQACPAIRIIMSKLPFALFQRPSSRQRAVDSRPTLSRPRYRWLEAARSGQEYIYTRRRIDRSEISQSLFVPDKKDRALKMSAPPLDAHHDPAWSRPTSASHPAMENHETECYILQSLELLADLATTPASQYCSPEIGRSAQAWAPHGSFPDDVDAPRESAQFHPLTANAPCRQWTISSDVLSRFVNEDN